MFAPRSMNSRQSNKIATEAESRADVVACRAHGQPASGASFGLAFAIGATINVVFVTLEVVFGVLAHSLALIADAGHNLGDVIGLVLAWATSALSQRAPTERRTYGLRSSTILAALLNAILLLIAVGAII